MILLKRIIVAVIFIPLILTLLFRGGYPLLVLLSIFSFLGLYELRSLFLKKGVEIPLVIVPLGVLYLWLITHLGSFGTTLMLVTSLIIVTGRDVLTNRIEGALARASHTLFALVYQVYLYTFVYRLHQLNNGGWVLISLIILVWTTDTFAYFLGMLVGKHRGVFQVSPKKSVEGFIAGFVFALIGAYVIYLFCCDYISLKLLILAAVSAGIFGQLGDLIESLIKRDVGVKDSSAIIPGHGGILDRFDSFIIAVPIFYLLHHLFI